MADKSNFLLRSFYKIFLSEEKYKNYKNFFKLEKEIKYFKKNLEPYLFEIQEKLKKKKEISILHSGHTGDIINILPIIKQISKAHVCKLYINLNKPIGTHYAHHPAGQVYINKKIYDKLLPLLQTQRKIFSTEIFNNHHIDINFDLIRKLPISLNFDSQRYAFHLSGMQTDLNQQFLEVDEHKSLKKKIIILRSLRHQNHFINYRFLAKYNDVFFIGIDYEYNDLKKTLPNLKFYECLNFLDMAQVIKSSRLFIGNSSLGFAIAEGLKVPRLLEASPLNPTQQIHGKNAYDFYFQNHFEKYFDLLYNG
tara:strand:- start:1235 stop:2158 length:924 start_codon:yes stop_codon:yes gene_type:complete